MEKSVRELIQMYMSGKLRTSQATQRDFIYNNPELSILVDEKGSSLPAEVSRSGDVITSVLSRNIKLPGLIAWNIQDEKEGIFDYDDAFDLIDGKQRLLSLIYFVCPKLYNEGTVVTRINGKECIFSNLSPEDQNKILDYKIDITWNVGTVAEEEQAFMIYNDRQEELKKYERLKGAYHGTLFTEFEKWLDEWSMKLDGISPVGRGEQAQYFLYMYLGLIEGNRKILWRQANDLLSTLRTAHFDPDAKKMDEKIQLYSKLLHTRTILTNNQNKDPEKLFKIVNYVIDNNFEADKVVNYYQASKQDPTSDIGTWTYEIHKTAIKSLCIDDIKCDYKRFLTRQEKGAFYISGSANKTCAICGEAFEKGIDTDNLEIDHIWPWSKGGRTEWRNLQFVHKKCNAKKGATINGK